MKKLKLSLHSIKTRLAIVNFVVLLLLISFIFFHTMQSNVNRLKTELENNVDAYVNFISQDLVNIMVFDSIDTASDLTSRLQYFSQIEQLVVYNQQHQGVFYYHGENQQNIDPTPKTWEPYSQYDEHTYISLRPLLYQGQPYGYVYIHVSTANIEQALINFRQQVVALIIALFIASALLTLLFNYFVSSPLTTLLNALKQISKTGRLEYPVTSQRKDEIGALFNGFNEMQQVIQKTNQDLKNQKYALDEHSIVAVTNLDGDITYVNQKFIDLSGYSKEELLGQNHRLINSGKHPRDFFRKMYKAITAGKVWHGVICNKTKSGQLYWVETTIVPLMGTDGKPKSYISIRTEVTQLIAVRKKAEYLSRHDVLTGLPNRFQVEEHLKRAIARARRNSSILAMIYMDLNKFKAINDTLGHEIGDKVLKTVAKRLSDCFRKTDFLARHGGDEFIAIIEDVHNEIELSHLFNKIIQTIEEPIFVADKQLYIGISMGISIYPTDAQDSKTLFSHADFAMYKAKDNHHSNYQFYTKDLNEKVLRRYTLESDLRTALNEDKLYCVFQPKVNIHTKEVMGAEVLIRWPQEDGSFISPAEFIPIAESCGLINSIWEIVLNSAIKMIKELERLKITLPLAVNVSPIQFNYGSLCRDIISALDNHTLSMHNLQIEITEGLLIDNNTKARNTLNKLSRQGILIAIDDFGTGYSSLKYLKEFPIHYVKLDLSFISGIGFNKDDEKLIQTMIKMARSLGKKVIAEGVENQHQLDFLIQNGCHYAQGYFYSKPLKAEEFITYARSHPVEVIKHSPFQPYIIKPSNSS